MRRLSKIAMPAVLAAGLLVAPGVLSSSASASSSLTLTGGGCEPLARRFLCSVSFTGAVAPVAIRWFVNGFNVPAFDNRTFVGIGCQPTFRYDIRSVISDATGASVEFRTSPVCRSGNP
ncbi:hypothetical protein HD597_005177 [Nonomuraea thailandensis]|uniref:Ig-like domain-containing protein n=1 Tax=Nonomuraea thailandensis TaxID=1188745 RepID=A0A9X2GGI9_9ACTN|nr:hypothetical protein [Nonomuraea thailandensis]MCP2358157.1 hypothetical protein [Nonomuraea thailandensis]